MRKILVMLFFSAFSKMLMAQAVVSDPGSYGYLAQQVQSGIENLETLKETKETISETANTLDDMRSAITKVNDVVKQIAYIDRVIENQTLALMAANDAYKYLEETRVFTSRELKIILTNFTRLIASTEVTLGLAKGIIEDGIFKMSDRERIEFLQELNRDMSELQMDIYLLESTYRKTAQLRVLKQTFQQQK
ncbi:hypothetical protein [Flexithrix dorotheae]|uniref:hypothetical protein n=1 Tax=Flexithrix dorotheae TaxID=70993 RepID=UPI0003A3E163|nr:hypothetical protein [Flexithrix dorotheae]